MNKDMHKNQKDISSIDQAKAGLKVFFCAVSEWQLSTHDAMTLLGNPSRRHYDEYKAGNVRTVSDDFLFRLAYLSIIYRNLKILHSNQNRQLWLKNGSEPGSKWRGLSPLNYMLHSIRGVIDVFDYLNAIAASD